MVSWIVRGLAAAVLFALAAFSIFGFLATFEPMDPSAQLVWRIIYGAIAGFSAIAVIWLLMPSRSTNNH